jgi:molecular chaperone DnaK
MPQIEVKFDIDANGILNVHAKDTGTGREQKVKVTASTNLSQTDIERMVKEAEEYAQRDAEARSAAEERNAADTLAYSTEKTLRESGDRISASDKVTVESALNKLREALKGDDRGAIYQARQELEQAWQPVAANLYSQAGPGSEPAGAGAASGSSGSSSQDDDVVDAEFHSSDEG